MPPGAEDALEFRKAIEGWCDILNTVGLSSFGFGARLLQEGSDKNLFEELTWLFAGKPAATLTKTARA